MQTVCVYCGSSSQVSLSFFNAASELGRILAENQVSLIYGGGSMGLMGEVAQSALSFGGNVVGVIPQFMYNENWFKSNLSQLIVVESMHERKQKMASMVDALVALPGGCGTMEELLEIITWKQLGLIAKPIVIVNVDNYYSPLLEMLSQSVEKQFMREKHLEMWKVVSSPEEVLSAIKESVEWDENYRKFAAI